MKAYKEDILGNGFEYVTLHLLPDYEGEVVATLVRRQALKASKKAVLYIHGYNDYFFQAEMAEKFNDQGFNFYAVDLRKYGRSYMPHQKFNDVRDLTDYFVEIEQVLQIIKEEGNAYTVLLGHSTGGLIATLFAEKYTSAKLFDAVILNSPFLDFNVDKFSKRFIPFVAWLGKHIPTLPFLGGISEEYGKSVHILGYGEWNYNLAWKSNTPPKLTLGWIRAIYKGHETIKKGVFISQPVLVLHSDKSVSDTSSKAQMLERDSVLNVLDIRERAKCIKDKVTIVEIEGGMHDLVLSQKEVRETVYATIFDWLAKEENI